MTAETSNARGDVVAERQAWYEQQIALAEGQWAAAFLDRWECGDDVPSKEHYVALWLAERAAPQPAAAQQGQAGAECHCATCTCAPGMTPAVRFDTSSAAQEGAVRDHLISLGWTPPVAQQPAAEEQLTYKGVPIGPMQTFADMERQASAPVGVEGLVASLVDAAYQDGMQELDEMSADTVRARSAVIRALAQQPADVVVDDARGMDK